MSRSPIQARRKLAALLASGCLLAGIGPNAAAAASLVAPEAVQVERHGGAFTIDVVMHTPVPPARAYEVLTDFDHMVRFVPNLTESRVLERHEGGLKIQQKGVARWGVFTLNFESVRELRLVPPREIRAHTVSGNVKSMDSLMQLTPEPGGTRLQFHAEVEPGSWFPPGIGPALVQHETAEQFSAMLGEMLNR